MTDAAQSGNSGPQSYDIETLGDILDVAMDGADLDALFTDLRIWVDLAVAAHPLPNGIIWQPKMRWVDDGEVGLSGVNVEVTP